MKLFKNKKITLTIIFSLLVSLTVIGGLFYLFNITKNLPPVNNFSSLKVSEATKIYDRTGDTLLYKVFGKQKRTVVPFDKIPEYLKQATIAVEDEGFYHQPAFDWRGILRALITNIKQGRIVQGGSTITQQLAKNLFLTPKQTITRKIKELILAIRLESEYTKDEILAAYLNYIPYGSNAYGVEAASQTYFNKPVEKINLAEAAVLASLPKAPTYYSPWDKKSRKRLIARKNKVLEKMENQNYITEKQKEKAQNKKVKFTTQSIGQIKAPHFSLAVKDKLIQKYGEKKVRTGGLKVRTTLDWEMQKIAKEVIKKGAKRNKKLYGGRNAALVAQDPNTGQILAMVGSKNYFSDKFDGKFNVATQGLRQPGSALKPFVYLTAFSRGYPTKTKLFDVPTEFNTNSPECPPIVTKKSNKNKDCFNPENFDGIFRGAVTMKQALSQSINVPSVKTLYLAGLKNTIKTLQKAGVTTLDDPWKYGLSLVLGGGGVKLNQLTGAYATLADGGVKHSQNMILEVRNKKGEIIDNFKDKSKQVLNKNSTRKINQILSSVELRAGLFQSSIGMTIFEGREVALKTGTTNDYRDAWAMGYTPNIAVGIWAGNNNNDPMTSRGSSLLAAVPMWNNFLTRVFKQKNFPRESFIRPKSKIKAEKPMLNGKEVVKPTTGKKEYPQLHSILYWVNRQNPLGKIPQNPQKDPQYQNWEKSLMHWAKENIKNFKEKYNKPIPPGAKIKKDFSKINKNLQKQIKIRFNNPLNGVFVNKPIEIKINIKSTNKIKRIKLFYNRNQIDEVEKINEKNYLYTKEINKEVRSQNTIEIRVWDNNGQRHKKTIIVYNKDEKEKKTNSE
ncbi:MAG: transglycosylase domain-containing protein [Candidatus Magasanikbacteria bacterium]